MGQPNFVALNGLTIGAGQTTSVRQANVAALNNFFTSVCNTAGSPGYRGVLPTGTIELTGSLDWRLPTSAPSTGCQIKGVLGQTNLVEYPITSPYTPVPILMIGGTNLDIENLTLSYGVAAGASTAETTNTGGTGANGIEMWCLVRSRLQDITIAQTARGILLPQTSAAAYGGSCANNSMGQSVNAEFSNTFQNIFIDRYAYRCLDDQSYNGGNTQSWATNIKCTGDGSSTVANSGSSGITLEINPPTAWVKGMFIESAGIPSGTTITGTTSSTVTLSQSITASIPAGQFVLAATGTNIPVVLNKLNEGRLELNIEWTIPFAVASAGNDGTHINDNLQRNGVIYCSTCGNEHMAIHFEGIGPNGNSSSATNAGLLYTETNNNLDVEWLSIVSPFVNSTNNSYPFHIARMYGSNNHITIDHIEQGLNAGNCSPLSTCIDLGYLTSNLVPSSSSLDVGPIEFAGTAFISQTSTNYLAGFGFASGSKLLRRSQSVPNRAGLLAVLQGANMNSTADQPIIIPAEITVYRVTNIYVTNCTTTLSNVIGNIYTLPGGSTTSGNVTLMPPQSMTVSNPAWATATPAGYIW